MAGGCGAAPPLRRQHAADPLETPPTATQQRLRSPVPPQVPAQLPPGATSSIAFVPGASNLLLFASPCQPELVQLYNFGLGSVLRTFQLPQPVSCLAACPRGGLLAFGLASGAVAVADAQGEASCQLTGHAQPVRALAFTSDGSQLLSAAGCTLFLWDRDALLKGAAAAAAR